MVACPAGSFVTGLSAQVDDRTSAGASDTDLLGLMAIRFTCFSRSMSNANVTANATTTWLAGENSTALPFMLKPNTTGRW